MLSLQDKYVYSARNAGKGVSKPHTHITHMLRQCTSIVYIYRYKQIKIKKPAQIHFHHTLPY